MWLSRFPRKTLLAYAWAEHNFSGEVNDYLKQPRFVGDTGLHKGSYSDQLKGMVNPGGWATAARRSGEYDDDVQAWLDDPSIFSFQRWRYGT